MNTTQVEIDEATMIAKNAAYKLAYELALEKKYGGNISCCMTKLKLLYMWAGVLSCQKAISNSFATIEAITINPGDTINIIFDGISITGGPKTISTSDETAFMKNLAIFINANTEGYNAVFEPAGRNKGLLTIEGPCSNPLLEIELTGADPVVNYTTFSGGYCAEQSCLTESKIKSLIGKVRSMCTA